MRTPRSRSAHVGDQTQTPFVVFIKKFIGGSVIHTRRRASPLRTVRISQAWARVNSELALGRYWLLGRVRPMGEFKHRLDALLFRDFIGVYVVCTRYRTSLTTVWTSQTRDSVGAQWAHVGTVTDLAFEYGTRWSSRTVISSASTLSARGIGPVLSGQSGPHRLGSTSKHSGPTLGRLRTSRSSTAHGGNHAKSLHRLALLKAVRLGAILLPPVDDLCHPGGIFPDAIRAQGTFFAHHPRSRWCNPAGLFGVR